MSNIISNGVDVSKYQGEINWQLVKQSGISFAFIRMAWSNYDGTITSLDPYFEKNMKNAIAAGINVGTYIYSYANTTSAAIILAKTVINNLKNYKLTMPVVFDYEDSKTYSSIGKQGNTNICKSFLSTIQSAGYYSMLYTYKSFANSYLDMSQLSEYDFWLAQYATQPTYTGAYGIWQYTSTGSVNGISGNVDKNYAYKDYPFLISGINNNGGNSTVETLSNKLLKVNLVNNKNSNQYFSDTNVNLAIGYLPVGSYTATQKLSSIQDGFWWVKFKYSDGIEYWAVYDNGSGTISDGRAYLVDGTLSSGASGGDSDSSETINELTKKLNELTAQINVELEKVSSLEKQIEDLSKENESLKTENTKLSEKINNAKSALE